jgi:hypothetical protein
MIALHESYDDPTKSLLYRIAGYGIILGGAGVPHILRAIKNDKRIKEREINPSNLEKNL